MHRHSTHSRVNYICFVFRDIIILHIVFYAFTVIRCKTWLSCRAWNFISSVLIKKTWKIVSFTFTDITSLSVFYPIPSVISLCISYGLPDDDAIVLEISKKCTASKNCKMNRKRKSKRKELRGKEDMRLGIIERGHGGWSMYFKPQIVTENCLVFKSQRLFAPRIPFFASVVLRQNGNADWSIVPREPLQKDSAVTRWIKAEALYRSDST